MTSTKWGIVSTIKAPTSEVLSFVAYHLELGADHITIFLDDSNPKTANALADHPSVTCICTDSKYWDNYLGRVPKKHQQRQTRNATRCYRNSNGLDWIAHIDVDEFLCTDLDIRKILANQPKDFDVLRMRPFESLCREDDAADDSETVLCKAELPSGSNAARLERELYPEFGGFFKSGFVSHTVGKIFVRTGLPNVEIRIHRAFDQKTKSPLQNRDLASIELCHRHVKSWETWLEIMEFRLANGSYRAELEQSIDPASGRMSRHNLFSALTEDGTDGLRAFFEEVCLATPKLVDKLKEHGLFRAYDLELSSKLSKHFPSFGK